jgi:predicted RNA-binding protein with TRAM domain
MATQQSTKENYHMQDNNKEYTEEDIITLEEGVEYYATIRVTSVKGEGTVKVTTDRGPTDFIDNAPEDAMVEIPASWHTVENIIDMLKVREEADDEFVMETSGSVH